MKRTSVRTSTENRMSIISRALLLYFAGTIETGMITDRMAASDGIATAMARSVCLTGCAFMLPKDGQFSTSATM